MKVLFAILLTCIGVSAQSIKDGDAITNWQPLFNLPEVSISYASIARDGDKVGVWFNFVTENGSFSAKLTKEKEIEFWAARAYGVIQCSESRITSGVPLVLYYDRNGRLMKKQREKDSIQSEAWKPFVDAFCEQGLDKKPLTAPSLKPQERSSSLPVDTAPKSDAGSAATGMNEHPVRKP